ncbi:Endonuclease-reverse transcriptase [Popillia japonica]|uniref:Endonuclease-reverse transcriptase n=1 Tax=Popillia japonica TaxID=7064 RepID=A0AAW1JHQ5_POPJA
MVYATAKEKHIGILVIGEPNKKRVAGDIWIKDRRVDVAVLILNRNLAVCGYKVNDGHLTLKFKDMSIACCYISPNIPIIYYKKEVDTIMSNLKDSAPTVILGDFKAKSPQWGSPIIDEKGTYWTDWISSSGMVGHNTGLRPTFIRGETKSFIDVTISTENIASKIRHWQVLEDETLTEHRCIYFEIGKAGTGKRSVFTKPAVDWKAFRKTLEITTTGKAAANYATGTRLIMQAFRNSTKRNTKYSKIRIGGLTIFARRGGLA